ncbi:MAG TPA: hypothetical protein VGH50_14425 [Candidatus Binatia bacterium]|jgi:hypothetical protein
MTDTNNESTQIVSAVRRPFVIAVGGHVVAWLRNYWRITALYIAATLFTSAVSLSDTDRYVNLIHSAPLSDFGHLLWIVLGWLAASAVQPFTSLHTMNHTVFTLMTLNWFAGLLSVVLLYDISRRIAKQSWVPEFVTIGLIFTHAFLNFAQTGSSYVPGLSMTLLGVWLLMQEEEAAEHSRASGIAAGLAFATAVGFWVPYIFAMPALTLSTMILFGVSRWRLYQFVRMVLAFGVFCVVLYGTACALQGIYNLDAFRQWAIEPGLRSQVGGFNRMVFGFARSFFNMGTDGVLFKRYLLHDPYNPVSFFELLRFSLGKVLLFYSALGIWVFALLTSATGRRFAAVFIASAVPMMFFAYSWQGGDTERYFPLYPAIFLMLTYAVSEGRLIVSSRVFAAIWVFGMVYANGTALSNTKIRAVHDRSIARIKDLQPLWKRHSRIATVLIHDDVFRFASDYPFDPLSTTGMLAYDSELRLPAAFEIIDRGSVDTPKWRKTFAQLTLDVWSVEGDLWVSKRALQSRPPRAETHWVEGDDPRVTWRDVYEYFLQFEYGRAVGGNDGFVLLTRSAKNNRVLDPATNPGSR